jgi:hypothetical protein
MVGFQELRTSSWLKRCELIPQHFFMHVKRECREKTMGLIYRKRVPLFPGVTLNFSRRGVSTSARLGPLTVNSRGRRSVNLPGPFSWFWWRR